MNRRSELDCDEEYIITVEVYKDTLLGKPFVKSAVLTKLEETFLALLRTTLSEEKPNFIYNNKNVIYCSTHNGTSITSLLSKPSSLLLQVVESDQPKILHFVINTTQFQLVNQSKASNIFDLMVRNANKESFLKSKYSRIINV